MVADPPCNPKASLFDELWKCLKRHQCTETDNFTENSIRRKIPQASPSAKFFILLKKVFIFLPFYANTDISVIGQYWLRLSAKWYMVRALITSETKRPDFINSSVITSIFVSTPPRSVSFHCKTINPGKLSRNFHIWEHISCTLI